ncbi:glutamine amidotransferase-related [Cystoisospora suis]|uniref:Glutamine amidotransferase-related n=1 Tax=Cystoisospora suis TaxID=483139 RepID=A0A2C6KVZ3_9APIC|nr:glutamine amidotransferase-related [Cystoisospora suis]
MSFSPAVHPSAEVCSVANTIPRTAVLSVPSTGSKYSVAIFEGGLSDETASTSSGSLVKTVTPSVPDAESERDFSLFAMSRCSSDVGLPSQGGGCSPEAGVSPRTVSLSGGDSLGLPRSLVQNDFVRVLVVSRRWLRKGRLTDYVSELHLEMLQMHHAVPVMVPRTPWTLAMLDGFMPMHGLLLVEGEDIGQRLNPYKGTAPVDKVEKLEVQAMHPGEVSSDDERDLIELELLRRCHRDGVPILAICRGSQLLNVFRGGSLFYDIGLQVGKGVQHINYSNYDQHRHGLWVKAPSFLADCFYEEHHKAQSSGTLVPSSEVQAQAVLSSVADEVVTSLYPGRGKTRRAGKSGQEKHLGDLNSSGHPGSGDRGFQPQKDGPASLGDGKADKGDLFFSIQVNSYHHQGVRELGRGLVPIAYSEDGLVEAFCEGGMADCRLEGGDLHPQVPVHPQGDFSPHFVVGLQFHPERMAEDYAGCRRIFKAFVTACRKYKAGLGIQAARPSDSAVTH